MQTIDREPADPTPGDPPGLLHLAFQRRIVVTALKVAFVVGTILNLINNGGRVLEGLPINWWQLVLNFVVPYCVSSYSAAKTEAHARRAATGRD